MPPVERTAGAEQRRAGRALRRRAGSSGPRGRRSAVEVGDLDRAVRADGERRRRRARPPSGELLVGAELRVRPGGEDVQRRARAAALPPICHVSDRAAALAGGDVDERARLVAPSAARAARRVCGASKRGLAGPADRGLGAPARGVVPRPGRRPRCRRARPTSVGCVAECVLSEIVRVALRVPSAATNSRGCAAPACAGGR